MLSNHFINLVEPISALNECKSALECKDLDEFLIKIEFVFVVTDFRDILH